MAVSAPWLSTLHRHRQGSAERPLTTARPLSKSGGQRPASAYLKGTNSVSFACEMTDKPPGRMIWARSAGAPPGRLGVAPGARGRRQLRSGAGPGLAAEAHPAAGRAGKQLAFLVQLVGVVVVVSLAWQAARLVHPRLHEFSAGDSFGAAMFLWAVVALTLALAVAIHNLLRKRLALGTVAMGVLAWWVRLAVLTNAGAPGLSYIITWPALAALAALARDYHGGVAPSASG
jgi:hypothetical protein